MKRCKRSPLASFDSLRKASLLDSRIDYNL